MEETTGSKSNEIWKVPQSQAEILEAERIKLIASRVEAKNEEMEGKNLLRCELCQIELSSAEKMQEHKLSTLHVFNGKQQKLPQSHLIWLPKSNRGYQMLEKMGWREGDAVGLQKVETVEPIKTQLKNDRKGLGAGGKRVSRVTHFPPHVESQAANSTDGLSNAARAHLKHENDRKRKQLDETKKERILKEAKKAKRDQRLRNELYSNIPEEMEQYLK